MTPHFQKIRQKYGWGYNKIKSAINKQNDIKERAKRTLVKATGLSDSSPSLEDDENDMFSGNERQEGEGPRLGDQSQILDHIGYQAEYGAFGESPINTSPDHGDAWIPGSMPFGGVTETENDGEGMDMGMDFFNNKATVGCIPLSLFPRLCVYDVCGGYILPVEGTSSLWRVQSEMRKCVVYRTNHFSPEMDLLSTPKNIKDDKTPCSWAGKQ